MSHTPTPLSEDAPLADRPPAKEKRKRARWILIVLLLLVFLLRALGLIIPYRVPTTSMVPALNKGDQFIMEGFTYLFRKPARGDIAVFDTSEVKLIQHEQRYFQRIIGEPGDRLRLENGRLYVNGELTVMKNSLGEIRYEHPPAPPSPHSFLLLTSPADEVTVPEGHYFVMGDTMSFDSRWWGFLPGRAIKGRVWLRYWPLNTCGLPQ